MRLAALLLAFAALPSPALAQVAETPSPIVDRLLACQSLPAAEERLSCFERNTGELRSAVAEKRVVITELKALAEARREQFGLPDSPSPVQPALTREVPEVKEIDSTVASARLDPEGQWLVALPDGAVWRQISGKRPIFDPKPGSRIVIREGTLGTYSASIDGQRAIKVRRER
ncbi:hypothetical protein [Altericroceibacterium xinjiangense]|uniref:hypothetical protein n=1 Tax=Altericroceibacterium xinjiangense TaxID=762261 RepID=UPI000F7E883B|nr:hypothetical protein [Altericroceibacterium xinjiangense]